MRAMPGRELVVIGAGGFGRETVEAIRALNANGESWRLLGYLDDEPARHGTVVDGVPVIGGIAELDHLPDALVVVCTGRPDNYVSRPRIVAALGLSSERYATIIHPTASVSSTSRVGPGSVLLAHVVLTSAATIGSHVAVMPQVTITHDSSVEDFATLASGVSLGGNACVGRCAYIGAGALIRESRSIGAGALVGMGAAVTQDVPDREVWAGVPARYIRKADVPAVSAGLERS
jgi:sugar O-acyltransferase (sialic acid O-acetyltransferase NeuD family)